MLTSRAQACSTRDRGGNSVKCRKPHTTRCGASPFEVRVRRRPTLPHPPECSTIGAEGLSYRVRNGTGRFPNAMTAETTMGCLNTTPTMERGQHYSIQFPQPDMTRAVITGGGVRFVNHTADANTQTVSRMFVEVIDQLVPVSSTHYCASTSGLSTQSSFGGLSHSRSVWISHLEAGFPLRCFQRLSLPNVANQPCPWQNNWHTRGQSIPVLSY